MILEDVERVLVIGPHTDDIELGAGGTVLRLKKLKKDVFALVLCSCKDVLREANLDEDLFMKECKKAFEYIGFNKNQVIFHEIETKNFPAFRKQVREILHKTGKDISPNMIIGPSPGDTHQDHSTTGKELKRAFVSGESIISYEIGKNNMSFRPTLFINITDFIDGKINALGNYQSQKTHFKKPYFDEEFIRGLARVRGIQSNMFRYAEAFEALRMNL